MATKAQLRQQFDRIWAASFQTDLADTLGAHLRYQALVGVQAALEAALVEELEAHRQYGFEALSFIITETHPRCGPPLHRHPCEAAHIVLVGALTYVLGDQRFTVAGPYIVKIPAGMPHTFVNLDDQPIRLIAVFPNPLLAWEELGPNPLVER